MSQKKTQTQVEDALQKETQARVEDILLRPDKYIGSIEKHKQYMWVYENDGLVYKPISYVHGLYRIFDEILINAAHNKMRDLGKEKNKMRDPPMDSLQVTIDREKNTVSVYNNGLGVSVKGVRRGEQTLYLPDLLFGHLRNSNDNVRRGDKGYGAKLTNIFSNRFVIETADGQRKRTFRRLYINNMGKKYKATIGSCKENDNWTEVTFAPDLEKFKMTYLEEDVVALMKKRVLDMAGCLGLNVKVELDGTCLYIKSFKEYVDLYLKSAGLSPLQRAHAKVDDRCEICVSPSNGKFQQVSFVNCIATNKGGTHVDYITNQITTFVMKEVKKKQKNVNVHAQDVKNQLWIFVNAFIDKPVFDSQTKETLTTGHASFGFKCDVPKSVLKDVANSGIVEKLLSLANTKLSDDLKKTDGTKARKIHGMGTRLVDAEEASGINSENCVLMVTEGNSAKAFAVCGLYTVGREYFGVLALKGNLPNVSESSGKEVLYNEDIQNIKKVLGLKPNKEYSSTKKLRYGYLMIMPDPDSDGAPFKGLLINLFKSF